MTSTCLYAEAVSSTRLLCKWKIDSEIMPAIRCQFYDYQVFSSNFTKPLHGVGFNEHLMQKLAESAMTRCGFAK